MSSTTTTSRQFPAGRNCRRWRRFSRLGARTGNGPRGSCGCSGQGARAADDGRGPRWFLFRSRSGRRGSAASTTFSWTTIRSFIPIRRRVSAARRARPFAGDRLAPFKWSDGEWPGVRLKGQVIYELHMGTFTPKAPGRPRREKLPHLLDLGVTLIEVMPVAAFPGEFGWGYDGAYWFAPTQLYGTPGRFRAFVDRGAPARPRRDPRRRLQPLRPVRQLHRRVFSVLSFRRSITPSGATRSTSTANMRAGARLRRLERRLLDREFHLDGLRLDATHSIVDDSPEHIVAKLDAEREGGGRQPIHSHLRRERAATSAYVVHPRSGRLRHRRPVERRLSSCVPRGRHGKRARLLRRLFGLAAGTDVGDSPGVSTIKASGTLGREASRVAVAKYRRPALRALSAEPRPGRQLGARLRTHR